jgi:hypothetical protein
MMMMHGLSFAEGRHCDLQDADKRVFEYDSMAAGRRCHGVISLREIRLTLRKTEGPPSAYGDQHARNDGNTYLAA